MFLLYYGDKDNERFKDAYEHFGYNPIWLRDCDGTFWAKTKCLENIKGEIEKWKEKNSHFIHHEFKQYTYKYQ